LSKINYRIHTDAIKQNLIPAEVTKAQASIIYANETDVLNVAVRLVIFPLKRIVNLIAKRRKISPQRGKIIGTAHKQPVHGSFASLGTNFSSFCNKIHNTF